MFGLARHPQGSPAQPDGLTHLICLACEAMLEGLENAVDTGTELQGRPTDPLCLNEICAAIQQIWTYTVMRLKTVSSTPSAYVDYDMVLPQLCPVIQWLLRRLHQYCFDEAVELVGSTNRVRRSKRPNTKSVITKNARRTELFNHNCMIVTGCLEHILNKSNDIQSINSEAFQALAAVFLEHLGSSVSFRVFLEPGSISNESGLVPPRGLLDTIGIDRRTAMQAAKLEAPHLIKILKALMRHGSCDSPVRRSEVSQTLQKSLLRGMFEEKKQLTSVGPNSNTDQDSNPSSSTVVDDKDSDEFLSQVWDILGWDIILNKAHSELRTFE